MYWFRTDIFKYIPQNAENIDLILVKSASEFEDYDNNSFKVRCEDIVTKWKGKKAARKGEERNLKEKLKKGQKTEKEKRIEGEYK